MLGLDGIDKVGIVQNLLVANYTDIFYMTKNSMVTFPVIQTCSAFVVQLLARADAVRTEYVGGRPASGTVANLVAPACNLFCI